MIIEGFCKDKEEKLLPHLRYKGGPITGPAHLRAPRARVFDRDRN